MIVRHFSFYENFLFFLKKQSIFSKETEWGRGCELWKKQVRAQETNFFLFIGDLGANFHPQTIVP